MNRKRSTLLTRVEHLLEIMVGLLTLNNATLLLSEAPLAVKITIQLNRTKNAQLTGSLIA